MSNSAELAAVRTELATIGALLIFIQARVEASAPAAGLRVARARAFICAADAELLKALLIDDAGAPTAEART